MSEYIEQFKKFIIFITEKFKYILISLIQFIFLESLKEKKTSLYNCINNFVDLVINKPVRYLIILLFIFFIFIYILFYNKFIYNFFNNNKSYDLLKSNDVNYNTNKISEIEYDYNKSNILSNYYNDTTYYKFCLFFLTFISFVLILLFYFLNTRTHTKDYGFYKDTDDNGVNKKYLFYLNKEDKNNKDRGKYDTQLFNTLTIFFKCILIGLFLFLCIIFLISFILFFYKFFNFAHNLYINIIIILFIFTFISFFIYLSNIFKQFITSCTNGSFALYNNNGKNIFNIFLDFLKSVTCTILLIVFFIPCIIYLLVNQLKYELKITLPITYFYFFIILMLSLVLFLYNKYSSVFKNNSFFNPKVSYNLLNYDYYDNKLQEPVYIKKYIKLKNFNTILDIPDKSLTFFEEKTYEHLLKKYLHKFGKFFITHEGFVEAYDPQEAIYKRDKETVRAKAKANTGEAVGNWAKMELDKRTNVDQMRNSELDKLNLRKGKLWDDILDASAEAAEDAFVLAVGQGANPATYGMGHINDAVEVGVDVGMKNAEREVAWAAAAARPRSVAPHAAEGDAATAAGVVTATDSNQDNKVLTSTELNDKFVQKFEDTKKYLKGYLNDVLTGNYLEKNIGKNNYEIYNYVINTINNYEIDFELYINANHNNNNNEIQILNFCNRPIISYKNNNILFYFYGYKFPIDNDLNYKDPLYKTDLPTYTNTNYDTNIDNSYNLHNLFTLKNIKFNKFNKFNIKYDATYISIYLNNKLIFNNKFKLHIIDMQNYSIIYNNISIGNNIIDISNDLYNTNIELLKLNGLEAQIKNINYKH